MDRINDIPYEWCKNGIFTLLPSAVREYFLRVNPNTKKIFETAGYIYEKTDLSSVQLPSIFVKILEFNPRGTDVSWGKVELEMRLDPAKNIQREQQMLEALQIQNILTNIALTSVASAPGSLLEYCQLICGGKTGKSWLWKLLAKHLDFQPLYDIKNPRFFCRLDFQISQQSYYNWINVHGYTLQNTDHNQSCRVTKVRDIITFI